MWCCPGLFCIQTLSHSFNRDEETRHLIWCHCFLLPTVPPLLLFFCVVGDLNPLSVLSRWSTITCLLWATQTLYECSKKPPTQTLAVWSVSTVVSTDPQGPLSPIFAIGFCSVGSGRSLVSSSEGLKTGCGRSDVPKWFYHILFWSCVFVCISLDKVVAVVVWGFCLSEAASGIYHSLEYHKQTPITASG